MKKAYFILFFLLGCIISLYFFNRNIDKRLDKQSYSVEIDDNFDYDEIIKIKEALKSWEYQTNYFINFKFTKPYNLHIKKSELNPSIISSIKVDHSKFLGYYLFFDGKHTILLFTDKIYNLNMVKSVAEHEIGHFLKLDHSNNRNDLMYHNQINDNVCITKNDLIQLCNIFNCNIENMIDCNGNLIK